MLAMDFAIRTAEAIDREIYALEAEDAGFSAGIADVYQRLDADEFDRGQVRVRARAGELTNGYARGKAFASIKAQGHDRSRIRDQLRALRFERSIWTRRVPVGMVEIAALLGYGSDAPRQWRKRSTLPPAAGSVSGTPYWWRPDVLRWALEKGKTRAFLPDEEQTDYLEDVA